MYTYTDAHCHIRPNTKAPKDIAGRICNTVKFTEWNQFLDTQFDEINFPCIGIHPWHIEKLDPTWQGEMRNILQTNPILMVGEVGLDKFKPNMDVQIETFTAQLAIASDFKRPIHLHCVGAWDKVLNILKNNKVPPLIVAHGFSGDPTKIQTMADKYNMYFSYNSAHTDGKFPERVAVTPTTRILIETDTFDSESEIEILQETSDIIASIRGCTPDEVVEQTYQNFQRVISYVRPID